MRKVVESSGIAYTFLPDNEPLLAERIWGIATIHLIDEITREPVKTPVVVHTDYIGLTPRVASDGLVGLVGIPGQTLPNLAIQSYSVSLTIIAEGYIPRTEQITINQDVAFPNHFTPTTLNLVLHRTPIVITGRVVQASGTETTSISGATVSVIGLWRTTPSSDLDPSESANLVSLSPLYVGWPAGSSNLRQQDMISVVGEDKSLLEAVGRNYNQLKLSDHINLTSGDIVVIDESDPELTEYLTVGVISGASTADQPATVTLDYPVARSHRRKAVVRRVTLQPPGANNPLDQDVISGDTCFILTSLIDLNPAGQVELTDGLNPPEYHLLSLFSVTSDSEGYYRLPPLSRVAQVEIEVTHGSETVNRVYSPDYTMPLNHLDFVF